MRPVMLRTQIVTDEVVIRRPVRAVYGFYRDFANLPQVLGDVVAVERVGDVTYRWVVSGPFGVRIPVTVTITEEHADRLIRYETRGPLRGRWHLEFTAAGDAGTTRVREQLAIPLGVIGRCLLALIGKFPDREVRANLNRLKQLLEGGVDDRAPAAAPSPPWERPAAPKAEG
jgi:uncharacterized membrane protein